MQIVCRNSRNLKEGRIIKKAGDYRNENNIKKKSNQRTNTRRVNKTTRLEWARAKQEPYKRQTVEVRIMRLKESETSNSKIGLSNCMAGVTGREEKQSPETAAISICERVKRRGVQEG